MDSIKFSYRESAQISQDIIHEQVQKLKPEINRLQLALDNQYQTPYASINLPFDVSTTSVVRKLVQQKLHLNPTLLVVIGIGGSHLGTLAIHEALNGKLYNELSPALKVYFLDTVDADYCTAILEIAEIELKNGKNILVNLISKSGTTTESIANFEIFIALIARYKQEAYVDCIVVTTDNGSKLMALAQAHGFACLAIPALVGGRYSVFSAVGLFPLCMLGVDIEQLCAGAQSMVSACIQDTMSRNPAAISASIAACHYNNDRNINDTFLFALDFEGIGRWYRQLMGESVGKEFNRDNKQAFVGITPTVSLGSTDLHSVGQLYLGGPHDKVTTFIILDTFKQSVFVPQRPEYEELVGHIQGKTLSSIMHAIVGGVQSAYRKKMIPFMTITIPEKTPFYIGQLLQMKMIEIMYIGYLLQVNPFDQPNVESYKQETREILSHE